MITTPKININAMLIETGIEGKTVDELEGDDENSHINRPVLNSLIGGIDTWKIAGKRNGLATVHCLSKFASNTWSRVNACTARCIGAGVRV